MSNYVIHGAFAIAGHPMFAMGGASRSVNITVNENQATEIPTEVRGYPYPMINISRSGGQEVGPAVSASPSTVSISKSVSRADSGTYTLTLFNSEGVATMVLDLAVSCELLAWTNAVLVTAEIALARIKGQFYHCRLCK